MYVVQVFNTKNAHGLGLKGSFETRQQAMDYRAMLEQMLEGRPNRNEIDIVLWKEEGAVQASCPCPLHDQAVRTKKKLDLIAGA